ncbi:MAG TPA: glycosyltransferase family 2 protein [Ignavibacteriaceae bacterium]|nr:glycosyltransferase family 2 protein [Ignavibacteriaceae bacterium]
MDVSIIIVNYNTSEILKDCIKSIYEHTKNLDFEVIIVDNASNDRTFTELKYLFPNITIIELENNIGFGKANNIGAKIAKGKYLFFLNSDTLLIENSILHLLNYSNRNESILGALGCILIDGKKDLTKCWGDFPDFYNSKLKWIFDKFSKIDDKKKEVIKTAEPFKVDYIIGAALFLSRNLFEQLQGFAPEFFMYFEEVDLQKRISQLNKDRIILPFTKIIHYEGGTVKGISNANHRTRMMFIRSQNIYLKKHNIVSYHLVHILACLMAVKILFNPKYTYKENWSYFKLLLN